MTALRRAYFLWFFWHTNAFQGTQKGDPPGPPSYKESPGDRPIFWTVYSAQQLKIHSMSLSSELPPISHSSCPLPQMGLYDTSSTPS